MSVRNNEDRFAAPPAPEPPPLDNFEQKSTLSFAVPTEFVDLPSKGKFYPPEHPLYDVDSVEIKYMTAKEEDILTSPSLLRKGLTLDRLIENIVIDKRVKANGLLVGDKNAILLASRVTGYGADYNANVTCPVCGTLNKHQFDLEKVEIVNLTKEDMEKWDISKGEENDYFVKLPVTYATVGVYFMTGADEKKLLLLTEKKKKLKLQETALTDNLKMIIKSANGQKSIDVINNLVNNMPAKDSRHLRIAYSKIIPNVDLSQQFECAECGIKEEVNIPLTAEFFWPKQ